MACRLCRYQVSFFAKNERKEAEVVEFLGQVHHLQNKAIYNYASACIVLVNYTIVTGFTWRL